MRNKVIGFIGLACTVGAAVTVQPLLANHQTPSTPLSSNSVQPSEAVQAPNVYHSPPSPTPTPTSEPLVSAEVPVAVESPSPPVEPPPTATQQQSTVRLEVSLSNREVTVYNGTAPAQTYPIAIGRAGHETPVGTFEIQQMRQNPTWIHPVTDERFKGGTPGNPLGTRWIGFWTDGRNWIGFHGTPEPGSVGQAISHGCLRMHNQDVEELFEQVEMGTLVTVVD
ncbi:L,D-transpeptidase [Desertifilum sp. FACHB-1129]|uniref:L,D-transpeptidase n=1 Tax=Desertifilum TaxID=1185872 RepID=UPI0009F2D6B9|nr:MULTISPECIES: L,D-transpeptidase [Desertifilum]MBD2313386.1 L,D-transpeptidase [Desertifilum sp. FACHB-1129]MBD2324457.1 L,D-transpeptidase [Desertifilum sp. FACHB-866]MBD2334471.1 L,D-transpeptidase [Desertifilum sp. FACHB-868]MDA0212774.1 L,D-transpeptidase [Cyanobacteria bacterium FC1]